MSGEKIRGGVYAITADTGSLGLQAKLLVESIRYWDPEATIVTFIPSLSVDKIDEDRMGFFKEQTDIVTGDFPIPEYPPSALQKAFVEATERVSSGPVIALDSDIILTAPLTIPSTFADAYIRPGGFAERYWGSKQSKDDWQVIFDFFDVAFPTKTVRSFCDRRPFFVPFYNAGVIVANDLSFAEDWLAVTKDLIRRVPLDLSDEFFVDQIALTVLGQRKEFEELTEYQNFQPRCRYRCPDRVEAIHYHNFANLYWISNPTIQKKLERLDTFGGIPMDHSPKRIARLYLNRLYVYQSRFIPYPFNRRIRQAVQRIANVLGGWRN